MRRAAPWVVSERDVRPSAPGAEAGRCLFCGAAVGAEHEAESACRRRTVVVRVTVDYVVVVPESWAGGDVEHHRNEGSWCSANAVGELAALFEHSARTPAGCPCGAGEVGLDRYEFVREATAEDEEYCGVRVEGAG